MLQVMTNASQVFNKTGPFTTIRTVAEAVALLPAADHAQHGPLRQVYDQNVTEMNTVLNAWIRGGYLEKVPLVGGPVRGIQKKQFANGAELLKAVVGEFRSKFNLAREKQLAIEAKNSTLIEQNLAAALRSVYYRIATLNDRAKSARILLELKNFRGSYKQYYTLTRTGWRNLATSLENPDPTQVTTNITLFHDVMEYFITRYEFSYDADTDTTTRVLKRHAPRQTAGSEMLSEDPQYEFGSVEYRVGQGPAIVVKARLGDDYRNTLSTPNESAWVAESARAHDIPLWASHSYTTLRMMQLVQWANYGQQITEQYEAVAWSIFAFWNRTVLQNVHPIHRFHEVMDIASNFGAPYTPFQYPAHAPGYDPNRKWSHWYSWLAS